MQNLKYSFIIINMAEVFLLYWGGDGKLDKALIYEILRDIGLEHIDEDESDNQA